MKGNPKVMGAIAKIGGKGKSSLKIKGDYKPDTFGKKTMKAPKKSA
jgi:hypothetical protein